MDIDNTVQESKGEDLAKSLSRYKRRYSRERAARVEAEAIADRGLRELWLANCDLDKRVAERTADLKRTLEEFGVVSNTRERFLSALSHEMRTPLNGVLGMLELLEPYTTSAQPASYLLAARESAGTLNTLVCRMLDLVELSSGTIQLDHREIAASQLVDRVSARWQHELLKRGSLLTITSFLDRGTTVRIDPDRWHQVIDELVSNTIAHADPGVVRVQIKVEGTDLVTQIEDSGPGITQDFEEIALAVSADFDANRSSKGLGLGLLLSRQLADAMGGELTITNRLGDRRNSHDSTVDTISGTVARLAVPADFAAPRGHRES